VEAQEAQEQTPRAQKARALDTQFPGALLHLPFDGGVPYETDYSVNLAGHKLQFPTVASGGIIGRPGKFGKAVQLAEATTNLVVQHPVFDSLSGWGTRGSPSVKELSTAWVAYGQYSCHIVGTDLDHGALSGIGTLTSGVTYTASADVKVVSGTARLQVYQDGSPFTSYGYLDVPAPYEGRVSFTFTMPVTIACRVTINNNGEGFWDGIQVEQKAYPTPFCYGDMGPGHAWTGTPHASASTRAAADLQYSTVGSFDPERGTVLAWFYCDAIEGNANTVFDLVGTSAGRINLILDGNRYPRARWGSGTLVSTVQAELGAWHLIAMTYDGGTLTVYVDGVSGGSLSATGFAGLPATMHIGRAATGAWDWANGYLDDLLILDRALTATEVKRLYEAELTVLCPPQSWQPQVGAGAPTWGFPGMTYIDTTNNRWYVNVGGTWRYVGLT
jgi:hypothetical protein